MIYEQNHLHTFLLCLCAPSNISLSETNVVEAAYAYPK